MVDCIAEEGHRTALQEDREVNIEWGIGSDMRDMEEGGRIGEDMGGGHRREHRVAHEDMRNIRGDTGNKEEDRRG